MSDKDHRADLLEVAGERPGAEGEAPAPSGASTAFPDGDTYRTLARSTARTGFWSWDLTTDRVWHSAEFYRLHGISPGALGERAEDYLGFVHPDDRDRVSETVWSAATGNTVPVEYRFIHPEGGLRHLMARSSLVRAPSGTARQLVGTVQDLTDIALARRTVADAVTRVSAYFDEMPTPAYLWRLEGGHLYLRRFNKAARARWGSREGEILGIRAEELCADRPEMIADIETCLRTQEPTTRQTYWESELLGRRPLVVTYVPVAPDSVVAHAEDVSELIEASEQAQMATVQLAEYFQRVPTPAYLWRERNGQLVLEAANRAGMRATGGRINEGIGMRADEMYADRPDIVADLRRALGGETFTREMYYESFHDRVPQDLVVTYVHIPPDAVAAHTRDVTQQRLMESALRESHEAARGILDACTQPIALVDVDGVMLAANDAVGEIVGVPRSRLLGRPMYEFFPPETVEGRRAAVDAVVRTGKPVTLEDVQDGRDLRARLYPLSDSMGVVERVVIYVEDVTEERTAAEAVRERERELTTIIERNPDGICLIVDGLISLCNGALADLFGCSKEKIEGQALHDLMIPSDRKRAIAHGTSVLSGDPAEPREYTLRRCDGAEVPIEIFAAAVDFRGHPALICTLRDIGKRRADEQALAESYEALRALTQHLESVREEERVQVARDLHDELGSVLTALKIDLSELEAVEPGEESAELLAGMSQRLDQAIEVGRRVTSRLRPGILDDLGLAAAAEWLGSDLEKRTGIHCAVVLPEIEPDLPEPIATAMFRILQEALTNVIRHADAGAVEIVLESDEASVSLTVSDDGKGLDATTDAGAGFGLLGMRERVRAFDGCFAVDSAVGRGTTIRVALPLGSD
ncbi:MAG: PAS domain-containing protein [Gemmatimonadota bacterium]|jgi:PAS domain S-box-containing protein